MNIKTHTLWVLVLLSGCNKGLISTVGPDYEKPVVKLADNWQAPQPKVDELPIAHQGQSNNLLNWWSEFNDPSLTHLIEAAEQVSYSVSNAAARIEQARANLVGADSAFVPTVDGSLSALRSAFSYGDPPFNRTQYQVGLQSSWEIDLFGGLARQQQAMQSQFESRQAAWHDARVAVAVEVANAYLNFRYCQLQVEQLQAETQSRRVTLKMTELAVNQGFRSLTDLAASKVLMQTSEKNIIQQQSQCDKSIKGLVALTAISEPELTSLLHNKNAIQLPLLPPFKLEPVPAKLLLQRPDLASAERDMAEASANIGVEQAKRWPKLSLSGTITPTLQSLNGSALALAQTWSIGPTLSLPLFDAGKKAANVDSAQAQYLAAASNYENKVRTAIKEVEEALLRIDAANQRLPLAESIAEENKINMLSKQQLVDNGLANLIDYENEHRNFLSAELSIKEIQQEHISAWIALYRAIGGGWNTPTGSEHYPKSKEDNS